MPGPVEMLVLTGILALIVLAIIRVMTKRRDEPRGFDVQQPDDRKPPQ